MHEFGRLLSAAACWEEYWDRGQILVSAEDNAQTCCQQESHRMLPPLAHQSCMLPQPSRALGTINNVRLQEREYISTEADLLCWSHLRITAALADLSNI